MECLPSDNPRELHFIWMGKLNICEDHTHHRVYEGFRDERGTDIHMPKTVCTALCKR